MRPAHCRHRKDDTAAALEEAAVEMGASILPINGVVDCLLKFRGQVYIIEWKSAETPRSDTQKALVDAGWVIHFVRDTTQLRDVLFGKAA